MSSLPNVMSLCDRDPDNEKEVYAILFLKNQMRCGTNNEDWNHCSVINHCVTMYNVRGLESLQD